MSIFSPGLLEALGTWQRGWRENQDQRVALGDKLRAVTRGLPHVYRSADGPCYRKRFLRHGEYVDILLKDELAEGVTSWTSDLAYAERFKGLVRVDSHHAAIFSHTPSPDQVVVNIGALWRSTEFARAAEDFHANRGPGSEALLHFRNIQSEIVLDVPLRGSEISAIVGVSSPFDELCDHEGIPESERDELFKKLHDAGEYPGEPRFTYGAPRAIANTIQEFLRRLQARKGSKTF